MVIAAAIVDLEIRKKLVQVLTPDYFYTKGHSEIWAVITELNRKGLHYDPATIKQLTAGTVDTNYLDDLITTRPEVPPNLNHHIEQMRWDRTRVEAVRGPLDTLMTALKTTTTDPDKIRAHARAVSDAFNGHGTQKYLRDQHQIVHETIQSLETRRLGHACYPVGLPGLDEVLIPGAKPGQVSCITGVSGSGKTCLTIRMALALALKEKRKVLFGAWEQGSGATLELLAAFSLGISRTVMQLGHYDDATLKRLREEMEKISEYVRFFELPFGRSKGERELNDRNLDLIHQYITDSACDVFIADLWRRAIRQFDPDQEEQALYRQQAIALETNAHCMLVHQQRLKDVEQRTDKRPTREGIKGSGAWIEVPDTIIGGHRPGLFKDVGDDTFETIVLKQRHGKWPLVIEFDWNAEFGSIANGRQIQYAMPDDMTGNSDPFVSNKRRGN